MQSLCVDARMIDAPGIGSFLKALLKPLSKRYPLTLLWPNKLPCPYSAQTIPVSSSIYSLKEQLELPLKIPPCSLFWSPHFNVPLLPIRAKRRLVTIHDTYHLLHPQQFSFFRFQCANWLYKAATRLSDRITTDSAFSKHAIQTHLHPKSEPLYLPPPLQSHFHPTPDERCRDLYSLPKEYLLAVGSDKPHKNLSRLFEAVKEFPILVVGRGSFPEQPNVRFLGRVPDEDLPALYSFATALVFPSLHEGFGLPPLEAMACGCPALVSNLTALPETCGEGALYFDPYHTTSLREAIDKVLDSPTMRNDLIEKGFQTASHYSLERLLPRYFILIDSLLEEEKRRLCTSLS